MKSPVARAGLVAVSVFAAWWLFRLTERGVGIGSDSVVYMAGARNLFGGEGFVWKGGDQLPRPINHYPPLYSVALVPGLVLDAPVEDAARWMNAIAMGANTFLAGALTGLVSSSGAGAVVGALLFVASEETISLHSWAMSDALYLFFALACAVSATRYLQAKGRAHELIMWMAASLGFLTRYVGASLFAIPLAATLLAEGEGQPRARRAAIGFVFAVLPGAVWLARNAALTGSATNRRPGLLPQGLTWWADLGRALESWFLPGRVTRFLDGLHFPPGLLALVGIVIVVALAIAVRPALARRGIGLLGWLPLAAMIAFHLAAFVLASWASYPAPDVNSRNLAPVFVGLIVLLAAGIGLVLQIGNRPARVAAIAFAVLFVAFKTYSAREVISRLERDGQGYTSTAWTRSPTVHALQDLRPPLVYANDIGAVYYFAGIYAFEIPKAYDPVTGAERADYRREYCRMRLRLRESMGALVFFSLAPPVPESAAQSDVVEGMDVLVETADGAIYTDSGGVLLDCPTVARSIQP